MTGKRADHTKRERDQTERERVGATLRQMRELRGVRSYELADMMGISRPYLANIEAGRKPLTPEMLVKAATALQVTQMSILAVPVAS